MCILVDESRVPPPGAWLGQSYQPLEFMDGYWHCSRCQKFGHGVNNCSEKVAGSYEKGPESSGKCVIGAKSNIEYTVAPTQNEWQKSKRRRQKSKLRWTPKKQLQQKIGGAPFTVEKPILSDTRELPQYNLKSNAFADKSYLYIVFRFI